ncbi:hypothetical protein HFN63_36825 [Rhizobium leguminosarum]|uniref:FAD/NAD(P)-binding protein n=1 Tax=Rhizobium leguminosarum TaxID=384 RepID=UPI001C95A21E|nr:FAD/NAD(P)-binding protein [Rhizobium leguminosarum]MBY5775479.1 hypothetical protein [Rhizobium leguminosarum]
MTDKSSLLKPISPANQQSVAVVGCGPTALYFLKHVIDNKQNNLRLIFLNKSQEFGMGMPYDPNWVGFNTLANIACEEVPELDSPPHVWFSSQPEDWLKDHGADRSLIDHHFIPTRFLLGKYLEAQFHALLIKAKRHCIDVICLKEVTVVDVSATEMEGARVIYRDASGVQKLLEVDTVAIASGHHWPAAANDQPRYYASPWPISKLRCREGAKVALLGTSLSSIDVCLDMARKYGSFARDYDGYLRYVPDTSTEPIRVVMHSRRGMLPTLRFHFENPHFELHQYVTEADLFERIKADGFLPLDFIFEDVLKRVLREKSPDFHALIEGLSFEGFIQFLNNRWTVRDCFARMRKEFLTSYASIAEKAPIYWREVIDDVCYTVNFYTKYMNGDDLLRVRKHLMPLVSYLVAVLPQQACEQLLAMQEAGCLSVVRVGNDLIVLSHDDADAATLHFSDPATDEPTTLTYDLVVDCRGQKPIPFQDFPFKSLVESGIVSPAVARDDDTGSEVPLGGIKVSDEFHPLSIGGKPNKCIFVLSAPLVAGIYPYHSGLPFCNEIARIAATALATQYSEAGYLRTSSLPSS